MTDQRPELNDDWFEKADAYQGEKLVRKGTDTTDQQVEESHRFFIRAARDFYDSGRDNFTPNYDNYGDLLASAEAIARLASVSSASAELEAGKDELRRLMDSIWRAEYRKEAPDWSPLDELPGMVSQIDNMYAGIRGQRDQARWDLYNSPASPEPVPATNQAGEVYLGAIAKDAAFIMDYGLPGHEEIVRVAEVEPADDACCRVRLKGRGVWLAEFDFRRRATSLAALATQPATSQEGEERARIVRWIDQALERADEHKSTEGIWLFAGQWRVVRNALAATPTPPTLSEDLREAAQAVVDDYPVAAGTYPDLEGADGKAGYGSIRRLAAALARAQVTA